LLSKFELKGNLQFLAPPKLNKELKYIVGKNATDTAPINEFLFGQNFAETLKAA
ncbi:hypothetical protein ALC56_06205, partial [Trachymyrmex septentrionalis]